MNPIRFISLLLVAAMVFPATAFAHAGEHTFESSKAWNKLDLRLREAWQQRNPPSPPFVKGGNLECLLKTSRPLGKREKQRLESAGFSARVFAGDIVTGSVAVEKLPDVAALRFVQAMELAVPLGMK